MDITKITKCEFEAVYISPSKLEKFFFKYFSTSTLQKNKWLTWVFAGVMIIPFLLAFIGTTSNTSHETIGIFTYIFCSLLTVFAIPQIYVWITHNARIKKIRKKLGITLYEYNFLVDKFYNENTIGAYIKNKVYE